MLQKRNVSRAWHRSGSKLHGQGRGEESEAVGAGGTAEISAH